MVEYGVLLLFSLALLGCVTFGLSVLYALLLGYVFFFLYGLYRGIGAARLLRLSGEGIWQVKRVLITYGLVGILTAVWRACGTISLIISWCTELISPSAFLLIAFLLCGLISTLTGSAMGSVATMGVVCMTMGRAMGLNPALLGGAILSGVRVGDRCSPMSSSACLVCEVTHTDLYGNIKNMLRTGAVPLLACCGIYALLDRTQRPHAASLSQAGVFQDYFTLTAVVILPALLLFALALARVNVRLAMLASICAGLWIACFRQGFSGPELLDIMVFGFHPDDPELAALLGGGGLISMENVLAIVVLSSTYTGIFRATGLLQGIRQGLNALARRITPYGALLCTAVLTSVITCGQSLAVILTCQLCGELIPNRSRMASALEDTAVVIPALIPWSVAAVVPLTAIGAPSAALLAACYPWLLPLWHFYSQRRVKNAERCETVDRKGDV